MKIIELLFGLTAFFSLTSWWSAPEGTAPPPKSTAAAAVPLSFPRIGEALKPALEQLSRFATSRAAAPEPRSKPAPVRRRAGPRKPRLVIDPGHGGHDKGAPGRFTNDKSISLAVALELKKLLDADRRIEVHYTRLSDHFVTLDARAELTRQVEADAFMSLHANGIEKKRAHINGVEVYHHAGGQSALLASILHRGIVAATRQVARGVRSRGYKVLRGAQCPATLVELGYVSNRVEEKLMMSPKWRKQVARALHQGLIEWLIATGKLPGAKPGSTIAAAAGAPASLGES